MGTCLDANMGLTNTQDISPKGYAALTQNWLQLGASLIRCCYGTSYEYIVELAKVINSL
jgi:hypothetical protein